MIKEYLFGSFNANKAFEIKKIADEQFIIRSCDEFENLVQVEETGTTLEENAFLKAKGYFEQSGIRCFSDDTGLEVEALNGKPGVYSSSFGGIEGDSKRNIEKLLLLLADAVNRKARFRTVICLYEGTMPKYFEGILQGHIGLEPKGTNGFGYDPIFYPSNYSLTLAEMTPEEKNLISHRKKAFYELLNYLKTNKQ